MQWYYSVDQKQLGPVSEEELRRMFAQGTIGRETLVWREGMGNWIPAGQLSELATALGAGRSSAPPPATVNRPIYAPTSGYARPGSEILAPRVAGPLPAGTVPSYLWQSICCLLLCCLPLGIVAVVHAAKVGPAPESGNLEAAKKASAAARLWCWWSFGIGLVVTVLYFLMVIVSAFAQAGL